MTFQPHPGFSATEPARFETSVVAEATAHGLRLQVEYQPSPNLALAMSGIPVLRRIVVHNTSERTFAEYRLHGSLQVGALRAEFQSVTGGPNPPSSSAALDPGEQLHAATLRVFDEAIEAAPGEITLRVNARADDGTEVEVPLSVAVRAMAGNEFLNVPQLHASLVAFVRPNSRSVTPVLRAASDLLKKKTGSGVLDGYQSGPTRAVQIAGAIYEAIRAAGVTYIMPPASFENTGQKVRTTDQVLADRFGTCIDLSVMYAACLEAAGLSPVIILTRNHAFAGLTVADAAEVIDGQSVIADPNLIANLIESGIVVPIELTGVSPASKLDFEDAVKLGRRYIRENFDLVRSLIDVWKARMSGVLPLPSLSFERPAGANADDTVARIEDREFVARSSLSNLTDAQSVEKVLGRLEVEDNSPKRFHAWKRDLLDLSLRNPLLNLPRNGRVVDLLVPGGMLAPLDDLAHSGSRIKLTAHDGLEDLAEARGLRSASEIDAGFVKTLFATTRRVFAMVDVAKMSQRLLKLKRDAATLEQETGSNYLYLAIGSLVHLKPSGEEARAPLFLLPVSLNGGLVLPFSFQGQEGEFAVPNLCLVQWLRSTKGVRLDALENPATDESGLAIDATFAELRAQLVEQNLPFRIDETASLAILKFSTFQIWRDLDQNWASLATAPIVEHLVERPGETFVDPSGDDPVDVDELAARLPVPADGSQMRAVAMARAGRTFVLEGPPGTGKSQTITNLIAELLRAGKSVLFVAEKQAALEVVHERLHRAGLGGFTLQLHGDKQSIGSIRQQLQAAISTQLGAPDAARVSDRARLAGITAELAAHPGKVHAVNAAGRSLWSAYDELAALGEGPVAAIPPAFLARADASAVLAEVEQFALAAASNLLRPREPWLVVGGAFAAEAASVLPPLAALEQVFAATPEAVRAALAPFSPGAQLGAACRVLDRAQQAALVLPPIPAAGFAVWSGQRDQARGALTEYRERHVAVLRDVASDAYLSNELAPLHARAVALDAAWFFPELRRRGIRKRLAPLLVDPALAASLPGAQLSSLLAATIQAAGEGVELARRVRAVPGVILPGGFAPWTDDALDEFDDATATAQAASLLDTRLGEGAVARLVQTVAPSAALAVRDAWAGWSDAVGASAVSLDAWAAGRTWIEAWEASAPVWRADLERGDVLRPQRLGRIAEIAERIDAAGLADFARRLLGAEIAAEDAVAAYLRGTATASLDERLRAEQFTDFDRSRADALADEYVRLGARVRTNTVDELHDELIERRPFPAGRVLGEVAELKRQIERKRGGLAFRVLAERYRRPLQALTPCFLMSPGSVAHYLPADFRFDVVVFDEASQIRVSQSIGALGRGNSAIIVGDSRQMPPTRIMEVAVSSDDLDVTETFSIEDLESILDEAVESGLPREWLNWHYRSHDERLIDFSNRNYYESRLVTLPSPRIPSSTESDPAFGLEWRRVDGTFERGAARVNRVEAEAIVAEIRRMLADPATRDRSVGVVTFNLQQRELVLDLLEASADLQIQRALAREDEPLFVKNLENVQGDERDTILFSLAFSTDQATGRLPLQFGPLILAGGERRLNVAITRARMKIVVFSSFDPAEIDLSRSNSRGLRDLRGWLEFAAGRERAVAASETPERSRGRFVRELATALQDAGLVVEEGVGLSRFKVDLAVRRPEDDAWRVGVIADGPDWAQLPTVADREGAPALLESIMRWPQIERAWLPAWIRDADDVVASIVAAVERAPAFGERGAGAGVASAAGAVESAAVPVAPVATMAAAGVLAPDSVAEPVAGAAGFDEFMPADTEATVPTAVLDDPRAARAAVERFVREALATEGPIELDRLVRIVAARCGLTRVVQKRRAAIVALIPAGLPVSEGGRFVWPADTNPAAWARARRADPSVRGADEIALAEIAYGMAVLLGGAFSMSDDELVAEAARAFGFARVTPGVRERFGEALTASLASGRFVRAGERVELA